MCLINFKFIQKKIRFGSHFIAKILYRLLWLEWNLNWMKKSDLNITLFNLPSPQLVKNKIWFILGTGSSVNKYREDQWNKIKENTSIGINYWVLHDFIANYYMLELIGEVDPILEVIKLRKNNFSNKNFIIKSNYCNSYVYQGFNERIKRLPIEIKKNLYLAKDFPIPGRSKSELSYSLNILSKFGFFSGLSYLNYLAQSRATITTAIILGVKFGFKEIVLCGVDLKNTGNFYLSDYEYYINKSYSIPLSYQRSCTHGNKQVHWTDRGSNNTIKVSDSLIVMEDFFRRKFNVKIYVGSSESNLFPNIPQFKWD